MLHQWCRLAALHPENRRGAKIAELTCAFARAKKLDTLNEEGTHGFQKRPSGKMSHYCATTFTNQAVSVINEGVRREWNGRGLRDLSLPPPTLLNAYRAALTNNTYKKPRHTGGVGGAKLKWVQARSYEKQRAMHGKVLAPRLRKPFYVAATSEYEALGADERARTERCVMLCCHSPNKACDWGFLLVLYLIRFDIQDFPSSAY